jgi:beta-galactosidase
MEQQPGPVNWAHWNPSPLPGMVRLWSWEAFAHGAGCVSYFRWRQAPFAQEQMHAGLNTPDNRLDLGGGEAERVAKEIAAIEEADAEANADVRSKIALVFDYEAKWMLEIQPQGADYHYPRFAFEYYSALRALGFDVDIVSIDAWLDGYAMIVVPTLPVVPDTLVKKLAASGAQIVLGPRTGSKTADLHIPANLPPGTLTPLLPVRVWRVESLRPNVTERVELGHNEGHARHWRDLLDIAEPGAVDIRARFSDGHPAYVRHASTHYFASIFDEALTQALFADIAREAGLTPTPLGDELRISRRGNLTYVFNYANEPHTIEDVADLRFVIGSRHVEPQGVAAYRAN